MRKIFVFLVVLLVRVSNVSAQWTFDFTQNSIPHCDSANKPTLVTVNFGNPNPDTVDLLFWPYSVGNDTLLNPGDTLYDLADSIQVYTDTNRLYTMPNPSLYKHHQWSHVEEIRLIFLLPPNKHFYNLPYYFASDKLDTEEYSLRYDYTVPNSYFAGAGTFGIKGVGGCPAGIWPFDTTRLTNKGWPAYYGQAYERFFPTTGEWLTGQGLVDQSDAPQYPTKASYKIVGDSPNSVIPLPDTLYLPTIPYDIDSMTVKFLGAPKAVIHDTMICTYTNCYGTVTIRVPMEMYTVYANTHKVVKTPGWMNCPFMGRADSSILLQNNLDVPLQITNLSFSGQDAMNFSSPTSITIPPHATDSIVVTLFDNDKRKDCSSNSRSATLTGRVTPLSGNDLPNIDSTFEVSFNGSINVYCPDYPCNEPLLKHGTKPAGIIFQYPYINNKTFSTWYSNSDSVTHEFYTPYYRDPHFSLTVTNPLPAIIQPKSEIIFTDTKYVDDNTHPTVLTQMIWPRDIDTIVIPVMVLGGNFQERVSTSLQQDPIAFWPNPAMDVLHISASTPITIAIVDMLGRVQLRQELPANYATLDVSRLPSGIYEILAAGMAHKFEIAR